MTMVMIRVGFLFHQVSHGVGHAVAVVVGVPVVSEAVPVRVQPLGPVEREGVHAVVVPVAIRVGIEVVVIADA